MSDEPEHRCPRCDFVDAITMMVFAGEFLRDHFAPEAPGQLNPAERALVQAGRSWLTDEAIRRCLDEPVPAELEDRDVDRG